MKTRYRLDTLILLVGRVLYLARCPRSLAPRLVPQRKDH